MSNHDLANAQHDLLGVLHGSLSGAAAAAAATSLWNQQPAAAASLRVDNMSLPQQSVSIDMAETLLALASRSVSMLSSSSQSHAKIDDVSPVGATTSSAALAPAGGESRTPNLKKRRRRYQDQEREASPLNTLLLVAASPNITNTARQAKRPRRQFLPATFALENAPEEEMLSMDANSAGTRQPPRGQVRKLRNSLVTRPEVFCLRHWVAHEHFYSDLEKGWFREDVFGKWLRKAGVPADVQKVPRVAWGACRRLMEMEMRKSNQRYPRRFSPAFISSQRKSLDEYRHNVRRLQRGLSVPLRSLEHTSEALYEAVPAQPRSKWRVEVVDPQSLLVHRGVCEGQVSEGKFTVRFTAPDLGSHVVADTSMRVIGQCPVMVRKAPDLTEHSDGGTVLAPVGAGGRWQPHSRGADASRDGAAEGDTHLLVSKQERGLVFRLRQLVQKKEAILTELQRELRRLQQFRVTASNPSPEPTSACKESAGAGESVGGAQSTRKSIAIVKWLRQCLGEVDRVTRDVLSALDAEVASRKKRQSCPGDVQYWKGPVSMERMFRGNLPWIQKEFRALLPRSAPAHSDGDHEGLDDVVGGEHDEGKDPTAVELIVGCATMMQAIQYFVAIGSSGKRLRVAEVEKLLDSALRVVQPDVSTNMPIYARLRKLLKTIASGCCCSSAAGMHAVMGTLHRR